MARASLSLPLIALCVAASSLSAAIPFEHVVVDTEFFGDCKAVGDLDADGLPDLVLANRDFLAWYAAPDWKRIVLSREGENFTTDMELADVDADGDPDIVVPDGSNGTLRWHENPRPRANPRADPWRTHLIGTHGDWGHDVEVADLNDDGKVDVVVRPKGTEIFVWTQITPDSWSSERLSCPDGEGLTLGDANGDGSLEIVVAGVWFRRDASGWKSRRYADWTHPDTLPKVGDINGDGRNDIVLTPSENAFRLAWFEAPPNPDDGAWVEHVVQSPIAFIHSLELADMDGNGSLDIIAAEMAQSDDPDEILLFLNDGAGASWTREVVATTGSHNLRVADLDSDGDLDLYGSNWQDPPVGVVEFWRNATRRSLDRWTHIRVDGTRPERAFGIAARDITGDGYAEIASGRFLYTNPGGGMTGEWKRSQLPGGVDAMLFLDADGDGRSEILAERLPDVVSLASADGTAWTATRVAAIPATEHGNGQGYALAPKGSDGKTRVFLSSGEGVYRVELPGGETTRIGKEASEEGVAVGDFDRDGDVDICAPTTENAVAWWENPGDDSPDWRIHRIGVTENYGDRIAAVDINGDKRLDIAISEETPATGASVYWFEAPQDPSSGGWTRHTVTTQNTTNSLYAADMDGDGDVDLVTAEHRGTKKVQIWENVERGSRWVERVVDTGKESHLGAYLADMDGDGDLDILSIAWDAFGDLHLWRNDARSKP